MSLTETSKNTVGEPSRFFSRVLGIVYHHDFTPSSFSVFNNNIIIIRPIIIIRQHQ